MMRVVLAIALGLASFVFSFRESLAGTPTFWLGIALPQLILVCVALHKLWIEGTLVDLLTPRWGDLSIGAITAMSLLAASWVLRGVLAPIGTPRLAWLFRLYLQLGNPEHLQRSAAYTLLILLLSASEEIVWRGMVLGELNERFGLRGGWPIAALLYAVTTVPTLFALRDPIAGLNPLLFTAALGCGLVWSFLASRLGRLAPVAIAHMAFSYFSIVQFRLPGM